MSITTQDVAIVSAGAAVHGDLVIPDGATGIVVFAHGSGSSRHSPRNQRMAEELHRSSFGTLLFDLLTPREDETASNRFDIGLLTRRLVGVVQWLGTSPDGSNLPVSLFGASTGAAAAIDASVQLGSRVRTVVSRGGRPDLAHEALGRMTSPCLFIVGALDAEVLALNREAMMAMPDGTLKRLEVIDGATHLFEEPGTLDQVVMHARRWFEVHGH